MRLDQLDYMLSIELPDLIRKCNDVTTRLEFGQQPAPDEVAVLLGQLCRLTRDLVAHVRHLAKADEADTKTTIGAPPGVELTAEAERARVEPGVTIRHDDGTVTTGGPG